MSRTTAVLAGTLWLAACGCNGPSPRVDPTPRAGGLAGDPTAADLQTDLDRQFPRISRRVPHFAVRMQSTSAGTRLAVLTELTYFRERDSRVYVPFLRYLLKDPSPRIRWEAIARLRAHGIFLEKREVPESFDVPLAGLCRVGNEGSLQRLRQAARDVDSPVAGWAITALAVAKDARVAELARPLTDSKNVFVRHSAACALVEVGQREQAVRLLEAIASNTNNDDSSGYYNAAAAELLVRLGRREYLETLIEAVARRVAMGYADSGLSVLEDLTGVYMATPEEWRAWRKGHGGRNEPHRGSSALKPGRSPGPERSRRPGQRATARTPCASRPARRSVFGSRHLQPRMAFRSACGVETGMVLNFLAMIKLAIIRRYLRILHLSDRT